MRTLALFAVAAVASGWTSRRSDLPRRLQAPPSCALDPQTPYNCPFPLWPETYLMNRSTIIEISNVTGWFDPEYLGHWGIVVIDWGNAREYWWDPSTNMSSTTELTTLLQAAQIKGVNPTTKTVSYRNMELALQPLESNRAVMYDPSKAGFFLQYRNNGTIYNEPMAQGDQYWWNYSAPGVCDYWKQNIVHGPLGIDSPGGIIDIIFTDDYAGLGEEHPNVIPRLNMSTAEVNQWNADMFKCWTEVLYDTLASGSYVYQALGGGDYLADFTPDPEDCTNWATGFCGAAWQLQVATLQLNAVYDPNSNQQIIPNITAQLAGFLVGRGPYGYVGFSWVDGTPDNALPEWNPWLDIDPGTPLGLCAQVRPGVFVRNYTAGPVELDCNTFTAKLPVLPPGLTEEEARRYIYS